MFWAVTWLVDGNRNGASYAIGNYATYAEAVNAGKAEITERYPNAVIEVEDFNRVTGLYISNTQWVEIQCVRAMS